MTEYRGRQGLTFIIMTNQSKCRCYINVLFVLYCRNIYQQHLWYGFSAIGPLCFSTMNSNEMHTFAQIIGTYSFTYQARSNSWVNVIGHTSRSQEELKVKNRVGTTSSWGFIFLVHCFYEYQNSETYLRVRPTSFCVSFSTSDCREVRGTYRLLGDVVAMTVNGEQCTS